MEKTFILLLLNILWRSAISQTIEFVVADKNTKQPIEFVNVFYPSSNEGSVSNKDGRVKLNIKTDTLQVSHISYEKKSIKIDTKFQLDTVYLNQKTFQLDDVYVLSINLKEKLLKTLKNYRKLYITNSLLNECTYKESSKLNGKLSRLMQVQLKWWSKNNRFNSRFSIEKQNQLSLINIDYSRYDSIFPNGGFLKNNVIISRLYLEWYLVLLTEYSPRDLSVVSVKKDNEQTEVIFDTPIVVNSDTVYFLKQSSIMFDNETQAITNIKFNCNYNKRIKKGKTPDGMQFEHMINNHNIEISFKRISRKKWGIAFFTSNVYIVVTYDNKIDDLEIKQELFITKTTKGGQIKKQERIDLNKPFYKSVSKKVKNLNIMLLNKEEEGYLKKIIELPT